MAELITVADGMNKHSSDDLYRSQHLVLLNFWRGCYCAIDQCLAQNQQDQSETGSMQRVVWLSSPYNSVITCIKARSSDVRFS